MRIPTYHHETVRRRLRQSGTVSLVAISILVLLLILTTGLIARFHDSVVVRRGQAAADSMGLFYLPTIVQPEYAPERRGPVREAATLEFLNRIAVANGAGERYFDSVTASDIEYIRENGGKLRITLNRAAIAGNSPVSITEGVPAAAIRGGFIYDDFTRGEKTPGGCLPLFVKLSAIGTEGAPFTVTLGNEAAAFGMNPRDAVRFLAGDSKALRPEARRAGETVEAAENKGSSLAIELKYLRGRVVIFAVVDDSNRIVTFARARIKEVTPPPSPKKAGLQSGEVEFALEPTAVSPSAVRGDGFPPGFALPKRARFGQVLRARTAN